VGLHAAAQGAGGVGLSVHDSDGYIVIIDGYVRPLVGVCASWAVTGKLSGSVLMVRIQNSNARFPSPPTRRTVRSSSITSPIRGVGLVEVSRLPELGLSEQVLTGAERSIDY